MNELSIFGDSILKGVTYNAERNKYILCSDREFAAECPFSVNNYSKMGATVKVGAEKFYKKLPVLAKGDAVLFEFGGNDCDFNWDEVSLNPERDFLPVTPENEFRTVYRELLSAAKSAGLRVLVSTLCPIDHKRYMSFISKGRSREAILRWLGDDGILYRWQEHYNNIVLSLASELSLETVDIRTPFLIDHGYSSLFSDDGIHPSEKGHKLIRKTIVSSL